MLTLKGERWLRRADSENAPPNFHGIAGEKGGGKGEKRQRVFLTFPLDDDPRSESDFRARFRFRGARRFRGRSRGDADEPPCVSHLRPRPIDSVCLPRGQHIADAN